jgi:CubicO group peptidase (beta-lactamase class C family)
MLTSLKNDLHYATPESQGIASSAILKFIETAESQIHELQSFILMRHGKIVAEGWWSPYGRAIPHMMFSLSKSFTSTAIGLAVNEGHFSLDDTVLSFFLDEAPAEVNAHLAAMRVRHLLTMSTGHAVEPRTDYAPGANWVKGFFDVPVLYEPGTHFVYNSAATYMLSAIIQKTTGMKLIDYLTPRLFEPLGIEHPTWDESPQGISAGGFGLNICTGDIARFGQMYLQYGMWQGKQLVPEAWVKEATAYHIDNSSNTNIDSQQGYGYQFWRCRHDAYRADGAFGQFAIVMQQQDAVLATTSAVGDLQQLLNLVWDTLLPALGNTALPSDPATYDKLSKKLSSLSIPAVQGNASSSTAIRMPKRSYKVDANPLNIETISFNFSEAGCTATIKTDKVEDSITAGYGTWQASRSNVFNRPRWVDPVASVSSGAWTADDTYTMVIRLHETPFYHTLVCRFTETQLTIESRINVSLEPFPPVTLVGYSI